MKKRILLILGLIAIAIGLGIARDSFNDDVSDIKMQDIYRNDIGNFGNDIKSKCSDQTITRDCDASDIDYSEPIYNGLQRNRSRCTYLYDADAEESNFNYYECGGGESEPQEIKTYSSSTNELIDPDDIEY